MEKKNEFNRLIHVSAREAIQLINEGAYLVDVRPDYELGRLFDVENVIYCPYDEIAENLPELPKDCNLIIADAVGIQSKKIASTLLSAGFSKICNLAGGIVDWDREGYPVTTDKTRIYNGPCMCQLKTRNKNTK